jgi:hypothetical protein
MNSSFEIKKHFYQSNLYIHALHIIRQSEQMKVVIDVMRKGLSK